jgi:putative N6-adenine-specific DNA methylase
MCGSGTFLVEAGMIAAKKAPALGRSLSIEGWPALGDEAKKLLTELRAEARAQQQPISHSILGRDREPEALEAAQGNVRAAGLTQSVAIEDADVLLADLPTGDPGLLVTNPPYGDRLTAGGQKGMKTFYFKLGDRLAQLKGWRAFILSGNEAFESAFHARPVSRRKLYNGPIECELLEYRF